MVKQAIRWKSAHPNFTHFFWTRSCWQSHRGKWYSWHQIWTRAIAFVTADNIWRLQFLLWMGYFPTEVGGWSIKTPVLGWGEWWCSDQYWWLADATFQSSYRGTRRMAKGSYVSSIIYRLKEDKRSHLVILFVSRRVWRPISRRHINLAVRAAPRPSVVPGLHAPLRLCAWSAGARLKSRLCSRQVGPIIFQPVKYWLHVGPNGQIRC